MIWKLELMVYWGRRVEYEGALLRQAQLADVPEPHLLMGHQQPAFDNDDDEDFLIALTTEGDDINDKRV